MGTKKADFKLTLSFDYAFGIGGKNSTDPEIGQFLNYFTSDPNGKYLLNTIAVERALLDIVRRHLLMNGQESRNDATQLIVNGLYLNAMQLAAPNMVGQFLTDIAMGVGTEALESKLGWELQVKNVEDINVLIDDESFAFKPPMETLPFIASAPPVFSAVVEPPDGVLIVINAGLERLDTGKFPPHGNLMSQAIINIESARDLLDLKFKKKRVRFNLFENDPDSRAEVETMLRKYFTDYHPEAILDIYAYHSLPKHQK